MTKNQSREKALLYLGHLISVLIPYNFSDYAKAQSRFCFVFVSFSFSIRIVTLT